MANKIQHLRSTVAGRIPSASALAAGEIAINTADKILYSKDDAGNVIRVGVGTYTKDEMDARFLPQGILPITRIGDLTDAQLPITMSGRSLVVSQAVPVIMSGRQFVLAAGTTTFPTSATTKPLYVYVTITGGQAILSVSDAALPESNTSTMIGSLMISSAGATSGLSISKVSRLDLYRPSLSAKGSAFPVSSGTPNTTGSINW